MSKRFLNGKDRTKQKKVERGEESLKELNTRVPSPVQYLVLSSPPPALLEGRCGAPATSGVLRGRSSAAQRSESVGL